MTQFSDTTREELENKSLPGYLADEVTEEQWEELSAFQRWLLL